MIRFVRQTKIAGLAILALLLTSWALVPTISPAAAETEGAGTIIVVDTTEDLADSVNFDNHTCSYTSGAIYFPAGDGKCTLRRAILEAGVRPDGDRPITIQFKIEDSDPNYDDSLGVWEVQINEDYVWELDRDNITADGGQVTIDGDSQPDGRNDGPKIMVNTNSGNSPLFGRSLEVRTSKNVIRNLGFIGGGQIILYEGGNLIENNWMGLTADGKELSLASTASSQAQRSIARGGIIMPNEDSDDNIIRNNIIIGATERAIRITSGGDNNQITENWIGLNADGVVPAPFDEGVDCTREVNYNSSFWYGGRGIQVTGSNNTITRNVLAGLHVPQAANDTPPITMEISGVGHTVQNNAIGVDRDLNPVGVCGQGMLLQGTEHMVESNIIVHSRNGFDPNDDGTDFDSAIITQSFETGSGRWITVRNNVIIDADEPTHPDHAYRFASPGVPIELRQFNPAKVTLLDGTTVEGTRGDDAVLPGPTIISADCPNCTVYLYADDLDSRIEAFELVGEALSDSNGDWSTTLTRPLTENEGLRTQSMANQNGVMHNFGAGTTSKLSDILYLPTQAPTSITITGPEEGEVDVEYMFSITVNPEDVTLPINFSVTGDLDPINATLNDNEATLTITWTTVGEKSFTITADNGIGDSVSESFSIDITEPDDGGGDGGGSGDGDFVIYLPFISR